MSNDSRTEGPSRAGAEGVPAGCPAPTPIEIARFEALRSAFYHDRRETRFRRIDRSFSFLNILLGSAAVGAFSSAYPIAGQILGFIVAATSAAQLVWDPSGLSRDHRDLRRRFYAVLAEIEGGGDLVAAQKEMTKIYADEPPINARTNKAADMQAGRLVWGEGFRKK